MKLFDHSNETNQNGFPFSCHGHVCEDGLAWRFGFKSNDFYAPTSLVSFFNSFPFGETLRYPSNLLVILILSIFLIKSMLKPFFFRSHQEDFPTWIANEKGIKNEEVLFPELPTLKPLPSKSRCFFCNILYYLMEKKSFDQGI